MTKVNLITSPDRIFNDTKKVLLIHPSTELQNEFQKKVLENIEEDLDLYIFDVPNPTPFEIDWLLVSVEMSDYIIVASDKCDSQTNMLLGYILAKSKTYWLTNAENSVYNHISRNRIYNLDFLKSIGD